MRNRLRVLVAKSDLDGHDRPLYQEVIPFLKALGAEVIYPGLHLSTETLARIALQENVDVVCISTHTGDILDYFERLIRDLQSCGHEKARVIGGGIIRKSEIEPLKALGVCGFFPSEKGALENAAKFLKEVADGA